VREACTRRRLRIFSSLGGVVRGASISCSEDRRPQAHIPENVICRTRSRVARPGEREHNGKTPRHFVRKKCSARVSARVCQNFTARSALPRKLSLSHLNVADPDGLMGRERARAEQRGTVHDVITFVKFLPVHLDVSIHRRDEGRLRPTGDAHHRVMRTIA